MTSHCCPCNFLKKQLRLPVWHAIPPCCSTISRMASPSQSRRISLTCCTCPDCSPLRHNFLRERDQYVACPVSTVAISVSRFIHADIRILFEYCSWTITDTRPSPFHLISSSHCMIIIYPFKTDILRVL